MAQKKVSYSTSVIRETSVKLLTGCLQLQTRSLVKMTLQCEFLIHDGFIVVKLPQSLEPRCTLLVYNVAGSVSFLTCLSSSFLSVCVCVVYLLDICSYLLAHLSLPLASPDLVMSVSQSEPREIQLLKINQSELKIGHRLSLVGSQHP